MSGALEIEALPAQWAFLNDFRDMTRPAMVGPLGTGKTRAFLLKDLVLRLYNWQYRQSIDPTATRAVNSMLVEPTFGMVRDILIPTIEEFLQEELGIELEISAPGSRPDILWPRACGGGRTMLRSAENPTRLAGSNLSHVGFDEPGLMDLEAISRASARARHPSACCRQVFFTGSPEGINHFSERYDYPDLPCVTYWACEWHKRMAHYPAELRKTFGHDESQVDAYLNGLFVPMFTGRCYRPFDPGVHVTPAAVYDPALPIHVSCDFNVDHMRWLFAHVTPTEIRIFDSITAGAGGDVTTCAKEVVARYGREPGLSGGEFGRKAQHQMAVVVTGDSTGSGRSAQTSESCFTLMLRELTPAFRSVDLRLPHGGNPAHRLRVDTVNWHLRGLGGISIAIHPGVVELVKDLTQEHWVPGKPQIDQKTTGLESARTHAAAAFGYLLWLIHPLSRSYHEPTSVAGVVVSSARRMEW